MRISPTLLAFLALAPLRLAAQQPATAAPGDTVGLDMRIAVGEHAGRTLRIAARPANGVRLVGALPRAITLPGDSLLVVPLRAALARSARPGALAGGSIVLDWPDGYRERVPLRFMVTPRRTPGGVPAAAGAVAARGAGRVAGGNPDFTAEVFAAPRIVAPGGMVVLSYTVYNDGDQDARVRLRLVAPDGWRTLDHDEAAEQRIDAVDEINGEIRVVAPPDAAPGTRVQFRLVAEVAGAPVGAEGLAQVDVVRRGGIQPGRAGLLGAAYLGTRGADVGAGETGSVGGYLDLSGSVAPGSTVSLSYLRGPRVNQAPPLPFLSQQADRYAFDLRTPAFTLSAGNAVYSMGTALTGPGLRMQGASLRRMSGRVVGEMSVGQPMTFGGDPAGWMGRARMGITTPLGVIGVAGSRVRRDSTSYLPGTEVRGAGLDAQLGGGAQRLVLRAGALRAASADTAQSGFAGEAQYALTTRGISLFANGRIVPPSIRGAQLPGREAAADAAVRLAGNAWVVGRASRGETRTAGEAYVWRTEGYSGGLRLLGARGPRVELRANQRGFASAQSTVRRTLQGSAGVPLGPLTLDLSAEGGRETTADSAESIGSYRTGLRWSGRAGFVSVSASYDDYARQAPRRRVDAAASLRMGQVELDGGAWVARGPTFGANPGSWLNLALPLGRDFSLVVGGEYMRWTAATLHLLPPTDPLPPDSVLEQPRGAVLGPWRATLGIRRRLVIPLGR